MFGVKLKRCVLRQSKQNESAQSMFGVKLKQPTAPALISAAVCSKHVWCQAETV